MIWGRVLLVVVAAIFGAVYAAPALLRAKNNEYSKWGEYDIYTDFEQHWPHTGVVREYWFTIENVTAAVDGYERTVLAVNGTVPGPTIEANWGDTIRVHYTNNLQNNGSGIHWHGIRQLHNNLMDGVSGVTECPLAPGQTKTYEFQATQYGTSWYHSHFSLQLAEGAVGPVVIHGPSSMDYDEDLGPVLVTDWYHRTAFGWWHESNGRPPNATNGLINGHNWYDCSKSKDPKCKGTGRRYTETIEKGKKYRLRLINGAADNTFKVSLDQHKFWVIANDFVPIKPFETEWVDIGPGQRYDLVVEANQSIDNYWFRAVPMAACSFQENPGNIKAIFRYEGADGRVEPSSQPYTHVDYCADFPAASLVPIVHKSVEKPVTSFSDEGKVLTAGLTRANITAGTPARWTINSSPFRVNWWEPSVKQARGDKGFMKGLNTYDIQLGQWVYIIVETPVPVPHPIHLHGHDFFVLAQGRGNFTDIGTLNYDNPPRRDVANLPPSGHLVLAWYTDNPGIWLLHCHLAWHAAAGFALQFAEGLSEVKEFDLGGQFADTCKTWGDYEAKPPLYPQDDSGV